MFHDKQIRDIMDMKIIVYLDSNIRLSRRVYRDICDKGRGLDTIIERYHKFVKPVFDEFIYPTREHSDLIVTRGEENTPAVVLVSQYLKSFTKDGIRRKDNEINKDDIDSLFIKG